MRSYLFAALALALGALFTSDAQASQFDVAPISLTLTAKVSSGMLAVTNRSAEAVRFHVTAYAWDQRADGEMVLTPTKDIVFFPAMLTLNPQEARNLRIGMNIKPGPVERTYRVFVQELPPLALTAQEQASTVRVLTKMGIPIFVEAEAPKASPSLAGLAMDGMKLRFEMKNSGNSHYRAETVTVKMKDAAGKVIHKEETSGWYVLAGGTRTYAVNLPPEVCGALKSIDVEVKTEKTSTTATLGNAACPK